MIYLITGAIGTGKTTYVVDQLMQIDAKNAEYEKAGTADKVRNIYSNIAGLAVRHEPLPDDWRTTPENSVVAIDECHNIDIFKPSRQKLHSDPRVVKLNESRHTGHDIYFITQAPSFLHSHIRGLVNQHFHFTNPMGLPLATVYMWRNGNTTTPDSKGAQSRAENTFTYSYKKDIQQNFKSIEDDAIHTRKVKIPWHVIRWTILPFIGIAVVAYQFTKPEAIGNLTGDSYTKASASVNSASGHSNHTPTGAPGETSPGVQSNAQTDDKQSNTQVIAYDPTKPYELDYTNYRYSANTAPQFAGCVATQRSCTCYTQQATEIKVERSVCLQAIKQMPFNPFKPDMQQAASQPTPNIYEQLGKAEEQKMMAEWGYGSPQLASNLPANNHAN